MTGKEKGAAAKFCSETENEKPSTFTAHHTKLTYPGLKHPKSCKLWIWFVQCKWWVYFFTYSTKQQWKLEQSITEIATESLKKETQTTVWNTLGGKVLGIYISKPVIRINFTSSWVNFAKQWFTQLIWSPFNN